jgi:hypothetical protein
MNRQNQVLELLVVLKLDKQSTIESQSDFDITDLERSEIVLHRQSILTETPGVRGFFIWALEFCASPDASPNNGSWVTLCVDRMPIAAAARQELHWRVRAIRDSRIAGG